MTALVRTTIRPMTAAARWSASEQRGHQGAWREPGGDLRVRGMRDSFLESPFGRSGRAPEGASMACRMQPPSFVLRPVTGKELPSPWFPAGAPFQVVLPVLGFVRWSSCHESASRAPRDLSPRPPGLQRFGSWRAAAWRGLQDARRLHRVVGW